MKSKICGLALGLMAATAGGAQALDVVALTDANELLRFEHATPGKTSMLAIQGTDARIIAIDVRPADGRLYGIDVGGRIYRIDPVGGMAEKVSILSVPLDNAGSVVADFNPQANRLRLIGPGGQSLRVNVDNGQAVVDGRLAYAAGDPGAGKTPMVTAGAYLNSVAGATQTQLFEYDSATGNYVIQDPPNDGTLATIGPSGLPAGTRVDAMDIFTTKDMKNYTGLAVAAARLWEFSITNGKMREIGPVASGARRILDIAVVTAP